MSSDEQVRELAERLERTDVDHGDHVNTYEVLARAALAYVAERTPLVRLGIDHGEPVVPLEDHLRVTQHLEQQDGQPSPAIERDRVWLQALAKALDPREIHRVTKLFNEIRPDQEDTCSQP